MLGIQPTTEEGPCTFVGPTLRYTFRTTFSRYILENLLIRCPLRQRFNWHVLCRGAISATTSRWDCWRGLGGNRMCFHLKPSERGPYGLSGKLGLGLHQIPRGQRRFPDFLTSCQLEAPERSTKNTMTHIEGTQHLQRGAQLMKQYDKAQTEGTRGRQGRGPHHKHRTRQPASRTISKMKQARKFLPFCAD